MAATKTNKIDEITEQLEQGVKNVFESAEYKAYLELVSKFYDYSINNVFLIFMQMPTATHVAGFKAWQDKFKRHVKKGEKGIKILAPCPHKVKKEVEDENGNKTEKEIQYTTYRAVSVFDISQTEGEDVPSLTTELTGDVADFATTYKKLESLSPVPVGYEEIKSGAKGYYSPSEKRIAINSGMADVQTLKTLVHEIAHAKLHDEDGEEKDADRGTKEVQAESVAYIVCNELGLDTSDYSLTYVAGWSSGKETKELTASMDVIKRTAKEMIEALRVA